ncbi:MAG: aminomethyl-transferring glycine dehydrogenase subunit GcvPA [Candidatus Zixiibacteriota bacterium]
MEYTSHSDDTRRQMLKAVGVERFDELIDSIPESIRLTRPVDIPGGLSEAEVDALLERLAAQNSVAPKVVSFLGGDVYDHHIPAAVDHVGGRSEFFTAYTPYQAEVAQGTLQATYEFQSMIRRLTALDVAQASLYDGGSAIAEAALMALGQTGRRHVILAGTLNPRHRSVLETYLTAQGVDIEAVVSDDGTADLDRLKSVVGDETACVIMPSPNYFGVIDDWAAGAEIAHAHGALLIAVFKPVSLGVLKPPGECGADIAVGEGQCLGNAPSFGGPLLGLMATRRDYIRRLPGRLVGRSVDADGQPAFVMTLQTREQHIRREKATSNICTAQALLATRAAIYLSLLGRQGFTGLAETCQRRAHYCAEQISQLRGFSVPFGPAFFNEFVVEAPIPARQLLDRLRKRGILGGIELGGRFPGFDRRMLVCVTERHSRDTIDQFVKELNANAVGTDNPGNRSGELAHHRTS